MRIPARASTALVALTGAALFDLAGLPLPFLLGPMFACLIAALAGARLGKLEPVTSAMRTILGVAVGASITPDLVDRLSDFALSVALAPLFILVIGLLGYPYFRRFCGFDPMTAYYSAMPGGLQDMIVFGQEAGGDARTISLVHATRVLVIVAAIPFMLTVYWGQSLDRPPGAPAADLPLHEMLIMLACAGLGWAVAARIKLFGASILGPLILTAAASLSGLITHRPPAEAILAAQFFIGVGAGVYYVGVTMTELRRTVLAALGYCLVLAVISVLFGEFVYLVGAAPQIEATLAFSPGGQAEMAVLAIIAGVDAAYVVTIHLLRLIIVIVGAPLVARFLR